MPYISDEPERKEPTAIRTVKEALADFKKKKLEEGADEHSDLISFLKWLIVSVTADAKITAEQEEGLMEGIDWEWWSTDGEPSWSAFVSLMETLPE